MKAEDYRGKVGQEFEVKVSAGTFRVRRPSAIELMRQGLLPTRLYKTALKISGLEGPISESEQSPEDIKAMLDFMANYLTVAAIEPKLVLEKPGEGELAVDELQETDFLTLFNAVFNRPGGAGALAGSFPSAAGGAAS